MARIGNHMKLNVHAALREPTRTFYLDLLGALPLQSPREDLDIYEFEDGFVVGVFFCEDDQVLSESDHLKAAWLEIKTATPEALRQRLVEFGVRRIDYPDKARFYFQAPGGQVFRLAPLEGGI